VFPEKELPSLSKPYDITAFVAMTAMMVAMIMRTRLLRRDMVFLQKSVQFWLVEWDLV
jgi:hypothetical protein